MKKFYLAHQFKYRFFVREIELQLEKDFNIELINPFFDSKRKDIEQLNNENIKLAVRLKYSDKDATKIVKGDLSLIDKSDGIISIIVDSESIGSYMEIFYCGFVLHKPVYIIAPNIKIRKHLWIRCCSTKQFASVNSFKKWLKKKGYSNNTINKTTFGVRI